jgi:hypothetical protein
MNNKRNINQHLTIDSANNPSANGSATNFIPHFIILSKIF